MFTLQRVFAFSAAVVLLLSLVNPADAQTASVSITIPPTGVTRDHQDGQGIVPLTQINYSDCLSEDFVTFTVNFGVGYNAYALEVWAGDSCDTKTNRVGGTATCWRVFSGQPNNLVFTFNVTVRDILSGRTGGNGAVTATAGTGGTDATGGTGGTGGATDAGGTSVAGMSSASAGANANVPSDAPSACIATSAAVSPQAITLFFLLVNAGDDSSGQALWKATYKLTAPAPPSKVTPGTGENIAPISWSYPSDATPDQTLNGFQFFCDPAPGTSGAEAAGVLPPPGSTALPAGCADSTILIPGTRPPDKYKCGTGDKNSNRGNATGLVNGVAYNVAVATTDTYRNIGVISTPACAIPQPVTGFFEAYRNAGGQAGGGFCSFTRRREPLIFVTLLGLASCLLLRRRRAT
jgi:hypothetical protein